MYTQVWWQRCVLAALLNGLIWLTPPPIHLLSLFMPYFSGYSIATSRSTKGGWAALQIGLVMGLTLGGSVIAVGMTGVAVAASLQAGNISIWMLVVVILGMGIGCYTGGAAFIGAFLASRHDTHLPLELQSPSEEN